MNSAFSAVPTQDPVRTPIVTKKDQQCGFGKCTPRWMQNLADPKVYLVIFCCLGILQGAYFTYFIGVISTLEKRYAFESKVTGIIMIADNISPIFTSLLIGYFGGEAHKPRLIAGGMLLVILSCFLSTIPYFMYGPALHLLSKPDALLTAPKLEYCEDVVRDEDCEGPQMTSTLPAVLILFLANFLNGFGYTAFYTIGAPYLDDNVKKKNSPVYFSAMSALRIFGPALGFLLSSFCLKYYEDPFYDPGITLTNPRWVGAWWMGFMILGVCLLVFTIPLAMFPRQLPDRFRSEKKEKAEGESSPKMPKLRDFPQAMKRLMKNPILVCHMISVTFQINGFAGYFVFLPKYMESQYMQSASSASLFSGATGVVSMLLGILLGGLLIKKFKPRPRYLTGYMVMVELFSVVGLMISLFLGCPPMQMPGTTVQEDQTLNLYNECNNDCSCTRRVFEPVCSPDGVSTYFSPCFAGCPNITEALAPTVMGIVGSLAQNSTKVFQNCKCLSAMNSTFTTTDVWSGFCPINCNMFIPYIIMMCISKFVSSTARVGNTLITFRCVDAKDKSFALGAFGSMLAMFAFIPYPLIFGALTDSACLVWEESCSKTGNCWLYDSDKFRYLLHGAPMILIMIGICFDGVVFLLSDRLSNFYGEDDEDATDKHIAQWLKEDDDDDIVFMKLPKIENKLHTDASSSL